MRTFQLAAAAIVAASCFAVTPVSQAEELTSLTGSTAGLDAAARLGRQQGSSAGMNGFGWGSHASTVHEGVGRAVSHIMDAYANQMISYAQARILINEAIAQEYHLRVVNVNTAAERSRMLRERREEEILHKWEWEQQAKARREFRQKNHIQTAYRLRSDKFDRASGSINWPETLKSAEFVDLTTELDSLFMQLADQGAQYDRLYRDPIEDICLDFRTKLWESRKAMGLCWQDYIECQKLIVGLRYTAKYWPGAEVEQGPKTDEVRLVAQR